MPTFPHAFTLHFALCILHLAFFSSAWLCASSVDQTTPPPTGQHHPDLSSFDDLMTSFLKQRNIPGAALAVARGGRLVYARGFGLADLQRNEPVQPNSLFRIASVSKPLTAVAILQLVERGRLSLDDKALEFLKLQPHLRSKAQPDARLKQITLRQLLQHTAGWDRDKSFDPMFRSVKIAEELGVQPPAQPRHIIRYMLGQPLDFDPGQRYAYSNFGYCVLGRIIEKASGKPYETYVQHQVLAPLGIRDMAIGKSLAAGRASNEVRYYPADTKLVPACVGQALGQAVPWCYGGWYLEAMDAHGGWIASAPDLVRFACALDDSATPPLLQPATIKALFARPEGSAGHEDNGAPKAAYYACGWLVRPVGSAGKQNTWHNGLFSGTSSLLVRRHDGLTWAVLFNTDTDATQQHPASAIDPLLHRAADAVQHWPTHDLFPTLGLTP